MELKFKGDDDRPNLPTLRQLLAQIAEADQAADILPMHRTVRIGNRVKIIPVHNPPTTFLYDGYVYAIVLGTGEKVLLSNDHGTHLCMNLRLQTIQAISLDRQIEPLEVQVYVPSDKAHRHLHVQS